MESLLGAPTRSAIASMQKGDFRGAPAAAWEQFNRDPQAHPAPTGEDIVRNAGVKNDYAAKGLGALTDMAADPSNLLLGAGMLPGMAGSLKGIKEAGNVADASELFKARGARSVSAEAKMAGNNRVADAMPDLLAKANDEQITARRAKQFSLIPLHTQLLIRAY